MTLRFASTALAALLVMAGSAQAASTASASITNISFMLIDTNLNDGIDASITFNDVYNYGYGTYVYSASQSYVNTLYETDSDYNYGTFQNAFLQPNAASAATSYAGADVETTESSIVMSASADVIDADPQAYNYAYANANAQPYWYNNSFTLSANTILVVSGTFALAVGVEDIAVQNGYYDSASASYSISGYLNNNPDGVYQSFSANRSVYAYNYAYYGYPLQDEASGQFYGTLFNGSGESLEGTFSLSANVNVNDYSVTPVPEAGSVALALAGLGVVGVAASRRRKV